MDRARWRPSSTAPSRTGSPASAPPVATISAAWAINREVQRRREEQAAEFSRQARRVLCWLEGVEAPEYEGRTMPQMLGRSSNPTLGSSSTTAATSRWWTVPHRSRSPRGRPAVLAKMPDAQRQQLQLTVEEPICWCSGSPKPDGGSGASPAGADGRGPARPPQGPGSRAAPGRPPLRRPGPGVRRAGRLRPSTRHVP